MRLIELHIVNRDDQGISLRNRVDVKTLRLHSETRRPLGSTSVNVHLGIVGRPGLDPGTLRVFPERPLTSVNVQICWPDEVECPPTSTNVLSRLTSWLDNWLDLRSFQGQVTIQFRGSGGDEFDIRLGGGIDVDAEDSLSNFPGTIHS